MRTLVAFLLVCAASTLAAAELHIFNWAEYLPDDVIAKFEKEAGCKILLDTYEDPESMIAKLKAGAVSSYDIVVPSGYHMRAMIEGGLLMKLDKSKITNIGNVSDVFMNPNYDAGNVYSLPYQWGTAAICYRKSETNGKEVTWSSIFDPAQSIGPFVLMDDMRETVSGAMLHLGFSINSVKKEELAAAQALLIATKKRDDCLGFSGSVEATNRILAGDAVAAICFNGDVAQKIKEDDDLAYVVPVKGGTKWVDNLCIPAKAPNAELAHAFINFTLRGDVAAMISTGNQYASPVKAADEFLDKDLLENPVVYPSAEVQKTLETVLDLGDNTKLYDALWTAVRAE